ncbi:MAG: 2Fe-2S iron-sulfur cluster-binding protein [Bacteroidia bacterium]|nr:2Fe-2S iron-sulfur cluster-binding protein [Bacteroidia bacterium]
MKVFEVTFLFEEPGKTPITVRAVEGDTILDAALDNGIELHHNCGGVCACSTCHVYIEEGMEFLPEITDKEEDFIDRAINPRLESRLGCQCVIGGPVTVRIPDQSALLGH